MCLVQRSEVELRYKWFSYINTLTTVLQRMVFKHGGRQYEGGEEAKEHTVSKGHSLSVWE